VEDQVSKGLYMQDPVDPVRDTVDVITVGTNNDLKAEAHARKAIANAQSIVVGAGESVIPGSSVGPTRPGAPKPGLLESLMSLGIKSVPAGNPVEVAIHSEAASGGIPGAAFSARVSRSDAGLNAEWLDVSFDVSGIAHAYGGDYGDRLQLVLLPACARTTPQVAGCLNAVPLVTQRDADKVIRARVPVDSNVTLNLGSHFGVPSSAGAVTSSDVASRLAEAQGLPFVISSGGTIIAAVTGASAQSGNFAATDLAPRGAWGVSQPTGAFTYSLPIAVPPARAGSTPSVSLNYSSAAVDAHTVASNGQTSILGEGWASPTDYIERTYLSCKDDWADGTHNGDLCWQSPTSLDATLGTYVLSLNGATYDLVWDGGNRYRAANDPSIRATRYTRADSSFNGDNNSEYFEVQKSDGSSYYFGYGHAGDGGPATNSVATEPVFGDDTGEPRCGGTAQTNYCIQGYRFMLDIAIDPSDNATTYFYTQEQNKYGIGGSPSTPVTYTSAIYPDRIDYGQRWLGFSAGVTAAADEVRFGMVGRCVEASQYRDTLKAGAPNCPAMDAAHLTSYPDVPIDLICDPAASSCAAGQTTPVFFATKRLDQINTFVRNADASPVGAWQAVDTNQLITAFPTTNDNSARALWLDSLYTHAWGGSPAIGASEDTYLVKFGGTRLNNRVDWSEAASIRALDRMRINHIWTDLGGRIDVSYATSGVPVCPQTGRDDASWSSWPNAQTNFDWSANTLLCRQVQMGSATGIFNNYVVSQVQLVDNVATSPAETYAYAYLGNPGWAYANSLLFAQGSGSQSWDQYRGFEKVAVTHGTGSSALTTTTQYLRGLDGRYLQNGTRAAASVLPMNGGPAVTDKPALQGMVLDAQTTIPGGTVVSASHNSYTVATLVNVDTWSTAGWGDAHDAVAVTTPTTASTTYDGTWHATTTTSTTPNAQYQPLTVTTTVDDGTPADLKTTCTATTYGWNVTDSSGAQAATYSTATKAWDISAASGWGGQDYITVPTGTEAYEGACGASTLTGKSTVRYDDATTDDPATNIPRRGLPTGETSYVDSNATHAATAKAHYDALGRIDQAWMPNDLGASTPSVAWTYATDADGTWNTTVTRAPGQVSTTWSEAARGNTVKSKGPNTRDWTYYQYDALGLLIAGWSPTQWGNPTPPSLAANPPSALYVYDVAAPGRMIRSKPSVVTSAQFVADDGTYYTGTSLAKTVRRSYTYLDGWGRTLEQQTPAADGLGGRSVTATAYDALGRVAWTSAPFANASPAQLSSGLVNPSTASLDSYTVYGYDARGRKTSEALSHLGAAFSTTSYVYAGATTTTRAQNGSATAVTSDLLGRMLSQIQSPDSAHSTQASITTGYAYATTASGAQSGFHVVTATDVASKQTVTTTDWAGRTRALTDPNAGTSAMSYDPNGNLLTTTSPAGSVTYSYDALGRKLGMSSTDASSNPSSSATWSYDPPGSIGSLAGTTSTTLAAGQTFQTDTSYTYNDLHQATQATTTLRPNALLGDLSGYSYTTTASYDVLGQQTGVGYPGVGGLPAEAANTGYTVAGRPVTFTLAASGNPNIPLVTGVDYDPTGLVRYHWYGNGTHKDFRWNSKWRTLDSAITWAWVSSAGAWGIPEGAEYRHVDGDSGRNQEVVDDHNWLTPTGGTGHMESTCYQYDGQNRLVNSWTIMWDSSWCSSGVPSSTFTAWKDATKPYSMRWTYLDSGQVDTVKSDLVGGGTLTSSYAYADAAHPSAVTSITRSDGVNAPSTDTFAYDAAGRETSRSVAGVSTTLGWDALSRLVVQNGPSGQVLFVYDADGQRVAQVGVAAHTATAYLGATELTDPNTASSSTGDVSGVRTYSFAGSPVAMRVGSQVNMGASPKVTGISYVFSDAQGSVRAAMSDARTTTFAPSVSGATYQHMAYLPYGATRGTDELTTLDKGWLGQVADGNTTASSSTGLVYLNARYYDPAASRFVSPDPVVKVSDPRTLDAYVYGANNPVSFTDASGLRVIGAWDCAGIGCHYTNRGSVVSSPTPSKSWWQKRWDTARGAYSAGREAALNTFALVTPIETLWVTQRRLAMVQGFMQGVGEYGWGTQIDRTLNPVHQLLEAGDATRTSIREGDDYGVGYNGLNTGIAAGSTALIGYGGAKAVSAKLAVSSGAADSSTTTLFRSVGPGEAADIAETGAFNNPPDINFKYFATNAENAVTWGKFLNPGESTIVCARVPTSALEGALFEPRWDGIGPAWILDTEQLSRLNQATQGITVAP
jgi:RHS repeat-associated protein